MGDHTKMWSTSKRRVWNVISFLKRTFMHDVIDHTVWVGKWVCSLLLGAFVLFSLLVFWEYGIFDPAGHIAKDTLVRLQRFCEIVSAPIVPLTCYWICLRVLYLIAKFAYKEWKTRRDNFRAQQHRMEQEVQDMERKLAEISAAKSNWGS